MDDEFRAKLDARIAAYRSWVHGRGLSACRLVQYCGAEFTGAKSLTTAEAYPEIEGLLCEGFYVDWAEHQGRVYLRVWEFGGPEPEWPNVFAESSLIDIDDLMRRAGFDA